MFFTKNLRNQAEKILQQARLCGVKIATAESCTGGLVAALLTEISGSSQVFDRGFITYSNAAKNEMLQVKMELLEKYGAVSAQVAEAMARGAVKNSQADIAVAITGIAGPDGGSAEKPVGLVYIAAFNSKLSPHQRVQKFIFAGERNEVRKRAVIAALRMLKDII